MAVHYATKAYVLHFSEALAEEVRGTGVTVTTLCPGPTESESTDVAGFGSLPLLDRLRQSGGTVARAGYRGLMRGRPIVVPGLLNRLLAQSVRVLPRSLVRRAILRTQRRL